MKKTTQRKLVVLLSVLGFIVFCAFSVARARFTERYLPPVNEKEVRYLVFGSYPQSEVNDKSLVSKLNSLPLQWRSYSYYKNKNGSIKQSDYMKYADVDYNGNRYRAVTMTEYRPIYLHSETEDSWQQMKYELNTVYWFLFEPINWMVLGAPDHILLSEKILDSQPINNIVYHDETTGKYYKDAQHSVYATDYATSDIRLWLNDTFFKTAFIKKEAKQVCPKKLNNDAWARSCSEFGSVSTLDRVFLLSFSEAINAEYGFSSRSEQNDPLRIGRATDYALIQGAWAVKDKFSDGASWWWLRTGGDSTEHLCACNIYGQACYTFNIPYAPDYTDTTIRPAISLKDCKP